MTRIAIVNKDECNPTKCQELCVRLCPINRMGEECIRIEDGKAEIDEMLCNGCGICPKRCPFGAISIINLPEELNENPIHQFGKNGFRMYRLPIPIFGKVVGILGRNGIGKSTALKILGGVLKPNMGDIEKKDISYDDIINHFKGTEAQLFFEKVKSGEIKISYKPQNVDMIPKTTSGKVRELLEKVNEKNQLEEIARELDIEKILDNDIKTISGGELQRVAIAATVLKDANLYVFDEPTSYLDIKQRLKVSKFIKELVDEETKEKAVLVVEHDLIILDYMTDLIHLMYGKESAYGIISQPRSSKNGINSYLNGYLREENIRLRDKAIKFEERQAFGIVTTPTVLTEWEEIEKQLGKFSLKATAGKLHRKEAVGILGENGIGKTSFVKILAGVQDSDTGNVKENVKVSYKPQYLQASEELVMNVLQEAVNKHNNTLIKPLNIEKLLTKQLDQLSGGELQRVAIARALSQDAQLFLLDEPSAYLDVEQRLIVSKTIKDMVEQKGSACLVVDHDLLFLDYMSDSLVVFEGEPAKSGTAMGPYEMQEGMNNFLKGLDITFRRDPENHRPRTNKPESQMDRKQKSEGNLYYT